MPLFEQVSDLAYSHGVLNPLMSKGGSNGPPIGFLDLKFEAFK